MMRKRKFFYVFKVISSLLFKDDKIKQNVDFNIVIDKRRKEYVYYIKNGKYKFRIVTPVKIDKFYRNTNQIKGYSFKHKVPIFNLYYVDKKASKSGSIRKRFKFREDNRVDRKYQNRLWCYKRSGFDRGHLAPDADFDYNAKILKTTYLTTNIVPQEKYTNRYKIARLEKRERKLGKKKPIYAITGIVSFYKNRHLKGKKSCSCIPYKLFKHFIHIDTKKIEKHFIYNKGKN